MRRCLLLAAVLFDPHRQPTWIRIYQDGTIDEAAQITPGQIAWLDYLYPARCRP